MLNIKNALKGPIRECRLGARRLNKDNPVLCSMRSKIKCMYVGLKIKEIGTCPTVAYILDYEGPHFPLMRWSENPYTN